MKKLLSILLLTVLIIIVSGAVGYFSFQKGYKTGKLEGEGIGFTNGYIAGENDGYKDGVKFGQDMAVKGFETLSKFLSESFQDSIDIEDIVRRITKLPNIEHEGRRKEEYLALLSIFHKGFLHQIANKLNFSEEQNNRLLVAYEQKKENIATNHFKQFEDLTKNVLLNNNQEINYYESYQTVAIFSSVVGEGACRLLEIALFAVPEVKALQMAVQTSKINNARRPAAGVKAASRFNRTQNLAKDSLKITQAAVGIALESNLCPSILKGALEPINESFSEYAILHDITNLLIDKHIRSEIVEIATVKDTFNVDITKNFERKIIWGLSQSTAVIKMKITGEVKAGFDIEEYFEIKVDNENNAIEINLPSPKILSNNLDYQITEWVDGWFMKIGEDEINKALGDGKKQIQDLAIKSGIQESAKNSIVKVFKQIFYPVIIANNPYKKPYNIYVNFKDKTDLALRN